MLSGVYGGFLYCYIGILMYFQEYVPECACTAVLEGFWSAKF